MVVVESLESAVRKVDPDLERGLGMHGESDLMNSSCVACSGGNEQQTSGMKAFSWANNEALVDHDKIDKSWLRCFLWNALVAQTHQTQSS